MLVITISSYKKIQCWHWFKFKFICLCNLTFLNSKFKSHKIIVSENKWKESPLDKSLFNYGLSHLCFSILCIVMTHLKTKLYLYKEEEKRIKKKTYTKKTQQR